MKLGKDSSLGSLALPNLPMLIEEAFAVLVWQSVAMHKPLEDWTIEDLAHRARMPIDEVLSRLERIKSMTSEIELSCHELKNELSENAHKYFLLDVREIWEWEIGRIEGSLLMAQLDLAKIFEGLKELTVVTICHHGIRSTSAALYLKEAGLHRVFSLKGGLDQWSNEIDTSLARY